MPASRSSTPSSTSATPSQVAPASSAARATGHRAVPVRVGLDDREHRRRARQLARAPRRSPRTAPRSTSLHTAGAIVGRSDPVRVHVGVPVAIVVHPAHVVAARNRTRSPRATMPTNLPSVDDGHVGHVVLVHQRRDVLDGLAGTDLLEVGGPSRRRRSTTAALLQLLVVAPLGAAGHAELDPEEDLDRRRAGGGGPPTTRRSSSRQQPDDRAVGVDAPARRRSPCSDSMSAASATRLVGRQR